MLGVGKKKTARPLPLRGDDVGVLWVNTDGGSEGSVRNSVGELQWTLLVAYEEPVGGPIPGARWGAFYETAGSPQSHTGNPHQPPEEYECTRGCWQRSTLQATDALFIFIITS